MMIQEVVCQDARLPCTQWGLSNPGNVEDQSQNLLRNQCHGVFHPFPSPNFPSLSAFQPPSPELHKLWTFAAECRLCYCRPWGSVGSWEGREGCFKGKSFHDFSFLNPYFIPLKYTHIWHIHRQHSLIGRAGHCIGLHHLVEAAAVVR